MFRSVLSSVALAFLVTPLAAQGGSVINLIPIEAQLEPGQEVSGALSSSDWRTLDDTFIDVYGIEGRAGMRVTIDLMSSDMDSRLYLLGPGFAETVTDDDGGAGCDARITTTLLEDGMYRVVAATVFADRTGVYTIRMVEGPGEPVSDYRCGGVNPETLMSLPFDGRAIAFGETVTGQLTVEDQVDGDRPVQAWAFEAEAGQTAVVTLRSAIYDTYLYVVGPGLGVLEDDDGAGDLDSKLDVTFPESGTYRIIASALTSRAIGSYTLSVGESQRVGDLRELEPLGTVSIGEPVTGMMDPDGPTWEEGRPVQAWALEGTQAQRVVITLESDEFDAFVYLIGPGLMQPLSNDDGGEGRNALLTAQLPQTGRYLIVASSYSAGSQGAYTLNVR